MLENVKKYYKRLENIKKYWKIFKIRKLKKIENIGEC